MAGLADGIEELILDLRAARDVADHRKPVVYPILGVRSDLIHPIPSRPQRWALPHRTPVRQTLFHPPGRPHRAERFGVEPPPDPLPHVRVRFMVWVGDGGEEVRVAPDATHIIGRTGTCPLQADRI